MVDLSTIKWNFACRSLKKYRNLDSQPPLHPHLSEKEQCSKASEIIRTKVKGYADDLNIDQQSHKETLAKVDSCCSDLDLQIRADKCVTLSFDGNKIDKRFKVNVASGDTQSISTTGTKFLGRYIAASTRQTSALSSTTLRSRFESSLRALESRPIRGEYKLWIYQHYLAPSFHFYLTVNPTSSM